MFLQESLSTSLLEHLTTGVILSAILILAVTWLLIRWLHRALDFLSRRTPRARFLIKWLEPVARISLWFIALFAAFDLLTPSRETFLAGVASVGIAIGFGAQDLVKNLIGGFVVLADRPYQLGDRVRIGEAYGEIDHIGLRSTKLTTPDDTRVTIPNADVLTKEVFNANSGVPDCQVVTDLYLPPDADPEEALRIGLESAYTCPYLLIKKPVTALVADQFESRPYLRLRIKAYVYDHRFEPAMQSDITARAKGEFLRRGWLRSWGRYYGASEAPAAGKSSGAEQHEPEMG
jgi:small-conductance mechanosensitive channel